MSPDSQGSWWGASPIGKGGWNIGFGEVFPFEEEWLAGYLRERIGEAVTAELSTIIALAHVRRKRACRDLRVRF